MMRLQKKVQSLQKSLIKNILIANSLNFILYTEREYGMIKRNAIWGGREKEDF